MKIFLNKNCSGYHWFEGKISGCEEYVSMQYAEPVPKSMEILRGLMLHSQYETCLAYEQSFYILSLNNLPEHRRTDEFGRPISLQIVFLSKNVEQLWKVLFYRLQYKKIFSDLLSKCFVSVMATDDQFVRCNVHSLENLLNSCYAKSFSDAALNISSRENERLLYVNRNSRLVMNNIGFSEDEIKKAEYNEVEHIEWLIDKNVTENVSTDLKPQEKILEGTSPIFSEEKENTHLEEEIKQNTNNAPTNEFENEALIVDNVSLNNQIELLNKKLQESEEQNKMLKADLASSESMINRITTEKNIELMRFKLVSIVQGIVFVLLLILYIIK